VVFWGTVKLRDIVIGLIILVLVVTLVVYRRNKAAKLSLPLPTPTVEQRISDTFNGLTIPEDVEKIELNDVSGGDGFGIATRTEVLADLPDLDSGYYQVYMDGKFLGKMRVAKGGFLFEGRLDGNKVEVRSGEKTILEGSF